MSDLVFTPVAHIRTDFPTKFGVPRQSGRTALEARVVFEPPYRDANALRGLAAFSHLWLVWVFSDSLGAGWSPTVRPPRLGGNRRMGVFATRSPFRPNPIGLSAVRLLRVETTPDGPVLVVAGADMRDGTPILDVKPYLPYADCLPEATGGWTDLIPRKPLEVVFPADVPPALADELRPVLADDPRPGYDDEPGRVHGFLFRSLDVRFTVSDGVVTVVSLDRISE